MCPYRIQKQHLIMNKVERFDFQPFNALINFVIYYWFPGNELIGSMSNHELGCV